MGLTFTTQSYTSVAVTAKFKAASEEEARQWAEHVQKVIEMRL